MRGNITPIIIWTIAAILILSVFLGKKKFFLFFSYFVGFVLIFLSYFFASGDYLITENYTESLSGHIYIIKKSPRHQNFPKGQLIAYQWNGGATYPKKTIFIKPVVGIAGDTIRLDGRKVWVNDRFVGVAKEFSKAGIPLTPTRSGVIPQGEFFVATPHPDSLDSRYELSGNVKEPQIIGVAYEIF